MSDIILLMMGKPWILNVPQTPELTVTADVIYYHFSCAHVFITCTSMHGMLTKTSEKFASTALQKLHHLEICKCHCQSFIVEGTKTITNLLVHRPDKSHQTLAKEFSHQC